MDDQQERLALIRDLGWLTCAVESEGCFSIRWGRHTTGKTKRRVLQLIPLIEIANKDPRYIQAIQDIGLRHGLPMYIRDASGCTKVQMLGMKRVLRWLDVVEIHLKTKRKRAALVRAFVESRLAHGHVRTPYTKFEYWCFKTVRAMNGKGRSTTIDREVARILRGYTPDPAELPSQVMI